MMGFETVQWHWISAAVQVIRLLVLSPTRSAVYKSMFIRENLCLVMLADIFANSGRRPDSLEALVAVLTPNRSVEGVRDDKISARAVVGVTSRCRASKPRDFAANLSSRSPRNTRSRMEKGKI